MGAKLRQHPFFPMLIVGLPRNCNRPDTPLYGSLKAPALEVGSPYSLFQT